MMNVRQELSHKRFPDPEGGKEGCKALNKLTGQKYAKYKYELLFT